MGFTNLVLPGDRWNTVPWMSWSPKGDRLAYFVRTEKERTLILENILNRNIEQRIPMKTVDEPESPAFSPDGRTIVFAGLRNGVGDIFTVDLTSGQITNLTNDPFADSAPVYSPDGKFIVYNARVSGSQKLFRMDLETKKKTQLTFGTQDESGAQFIDANTLVFSSTAIDPALPIEPAVAKNGNIYNIWTLDLRNGELRQYTDALGGNLSAIVLNQGNTNKIAFVTYYKGEYGLHTLDRKEPLHTAASADFGAPGPIVDFQAPLQHTLVKQNARRKKPFEKMFLEGRPPVNVGVTSNGDVFGGSQISFGDVLGDQQFNVFVASIAQYRTMSGTYVNLAHRFQFALQGYSQTQFFYGALGGAFFDPSLSPYISRNLAIATRTIRGASAFGIYPLDRYRRLEMTGSVYQLDEQYDDPGFQAQVQNIQKSTYGQTVFRNGTVVPLGVAFVQETTVFREFGPLAGNTMRLAYNVAPPIAGTLSRQTVDTDLRHYFRIGGTGVFATRFRGFRSIGDFPDFTYFGGNADLRGYDYLQFAGSRMIYGNAELRFPIIDAALTPIGVVGGIRGVFFAGMGGAWFERQPSADPCAASAADAGNISPITPLVGRYQFATSKTEFCRPFLGTITDPNTGGPKTDPAGNPVVQIGQVTPVSGFRLKDGRASYGLGLETFVLGFPIHFDWSWRTLFNRSWENVLFAANCGGPNCGSSNFRKPQFAVWVGYDF
jgi:hypothetical protein